jgi:hypothetical protein
MENGRNGRWNKIEDGTR